MFTSETSDTLPGHPDAVTRPTVVVVGGTSFNGAAARQFHRHRVKAVELPPDPSGLVEAAGRVCYDSFDAGSPSDGYVGRLVERMHFSVLEHASWTLAVRGVSRTLLAELTRHRHASPSVRSQRYVDESRCRFVVPPDLPAVDEGWWLDGCRRAREGYRRLLARGLDAGLGRKAAHGLARSLLPGCTEVELYVTGNARTWRELIQKRTGPAVEPEFDRLAGVVLRVLTPHLPAAFDGVG